MATSNAERAMTTDRRRRERRLSATAPQAGLEVITLEPIRRLTAAVERLAARFPDNVSSSPIKPTCTVEEAAALLGTTAKGIYALHERGKLPRSIGPGRRLVFLREELLQWVRRASPSGGNGR